ncbi:MAG TPA: glutamine synthetase family protein [Gaiellaceae bacterium]|nr:glutamine synthetase family protein [Gaiellaceae bacterium]
MAVVERPSLVQEVLSKGPIPDPHPTLDEARNDPARWAKIDEIRARIDELGIKYIFFQQVSVSGHVNGKGVAASMWERVASEGYQLVYGATADLFVDRADRYIGFGPEESELAAIADLDTFQQLPWDSRVARVFCDCYDTETGKLLEADPRQNLKRTVNEIEAELGYTFLCGIEPEMMWMRRPTGADAGAAEGLTKPWCYHINQFEELRPVILDVIEYGEKLGIHPTYGDHEDSPGQLELNFLFDRAVRTADNLSTYRQLCAAVAREHTRRGTYGDDYEVLATFMPKPFTGVSANGAHHHFTLVDEEGNNVFYDKDGPAKLSKIGLQFMGGILEHARGLCAITAPTVNSYKRFWDFGFWAPIYKDYGWQNRTTLVRVASGGRFEFRAVDSSCNPYLTQAALLRAGLDGVKRKLDPGKPQQRNIYDVIEEGAEVERVPDHLGEALQALEEDDVVKSALPGRLLDVYLHYKKDEWERFLAAVTDWERDRYLDVLP